MQREVHFSWSKNRQPIPYVREVIDYANDGTLGFLLFDGHWYRREEPLPRTMEFTTKLVGTHPFETGVDASGARYEKHAVESICTYKVSVTAHLEIQDTSEYWHDEEVGGNICLFPTAKQRIEFRVLEVVGEQASDVRIVTHHTMWIPKRPIIGRDMQEISADEVNDLDEC